MPLCEAIKYVVFCYSSHKKQIYRLYRFPSREQVGSRMYGPQPWIEAGAETLGADSSLHVVKPDVTKEELVSGSWNNVCALPGQYGQSSNWRIFGLRD